MQSYPHILLVVVYAATLCLGCICLFSDGEYLERMLSADAPFARSQQECEKILRVASTTRLGIENSPALVYITAIKLSVKAVLLIAVLFILSTLLILFYADMRGSLSQYGSAFLLPLWILAAANIVNPLLKLYLCRASASASLAMLLRPFDWNDEWHVLMLKADIFFITYLCATGISCAKVAGIRRIEGIALVAFVWLILYFSGMMFGIEPLATL